MVDKRFVVKMRMFSNLFYSITWNEKIKETKRTVRPLGKI